MHKSTMSLVVGLLVYSSTSFGGAPCKSYRIACKNDPSVKSAMGAGGRQAMWNCIKSKAGEDGGQGQACVSMANHILEHMSAHKGAVGAAPGTDSAAPGTGGGNPPDAGKEDGGKAP